MIGWPLALKWAVLWASCDSQHPTCPHTVQTRRLKSLWQPSHVCERGPPSCPSRGGIPPSSSLPSVLIHFRRRCARLLELEAWSSRVIQSPHQLLRPPFDPRHVVELDLLVAPNPIGELGDLDYERQRIWLEPLHSRLDHLAVPADQSSLLATGARVAKWVQSSSSQPTHPAQHPESRGEPRPELQLALQPERAQERRMEVVAEPFGLGEQAAGLSEERLLQMQPRHLVLILVRHQLVQVADHSMSQE